MGQSCHCEVRTCCAHKEAAHPMEAANPTKACKHTKLKSGQSDRIQAVKTTGFKFKRQSIHSIEIGAI